MFTVINAVLRFINMLKACLSLDHTWTWCCIPWNLSKHTYITSPAGDLRKILYFLSVGLPLPLCQIQLARLGFVHWFLLWVRQMLYIIFFLTCLKNLGLAGMLLISIDWHPDTETYGRLGKIPPRRRNSIGPPRCTPSALYSVGLSASLICFIVSGYCESELATFYS